MKFIVGKRPEWKSKPKASPLDTDVEFLKLRNAILTGQLKPFEEAGIEVHEDTDGKRLKVKAPARLIRDHLNRMLKETKLEAEYAVTCRQTDTPGVWGVWVLHQPRESTIGVKRDGRRTRHPQENELEPIA